MLPDEVTIVRAGHPLRGARVRVTPTNRRRRDGRIQIVLPDGGSALIPMTWTDLGGSATAVDDSREAPMLSRNGIRRLIRLVDVLSSDESDRSRSA